jgi:hypothetical protein
MRRAVGRWTFVARTDNITTHMRILSLSALLAFAAFSQHALAQFDIGDNVAGLSIGIGGNYVTNTSQSPAIGLSFEHGVSDLGPGTLGIGGFLGYKSLSYESNYFFYQYDWKYTYLIIGARGVWHYNYWHGNESLDTYGGLMLSYNSVKWTDNTVYPNGVLHASEGGASSGIGLTGFLGARYYFSENFGAHAELGYGITVLSVGVSYKF